ncbi:MAG: choice-of-anchor Q domain-containing protein, partial [Planctomycetota bacterium]
GAPPPENIYVSNSGDNANDGLTWGTAVKTIQRALDLGASNVSTIWVADGYYTGPGNYNLDFNRKVLFLKSQNGPQSCTIDGGGSNRCIHLYDRILPPEGTALIDGFTLINGYGDNGGAIKSSSYAAIVRNCIIQNSIAMLGGGGIYMGNNSYVDVENCIIDNNSTAGFGGGIYAEFGNYDVKYCIITNNSAGERGGGTYDIHISVNIYWSCLISNNDAPNATGGGVCSEDGANTTLYSCTVAKNTAGDIGGGLLCNDSAVFIRNTIIWHNSAPSGGNEIANMYGIPAVSLLFSDYANSAGDIWGTGYGVLGGCMELDPLFTDLSGNNFHLQYSSPCINLGCNGYASPGLMPTDLDGNPRIIDGIVDMGCYETDPLPTEPTSLLTNGRVNPNSLGSALVWFSAVYHDTGDPSNANAAWIQVSNSPAFTILPVEQQLDSDCGNRR